MRSLLHTTCPGLTNLRLSCHEGSPLLSRFLLAAGAVTGCQREERDTRPYSRLGDGDQPVAVTTLEPGGQRPDTSDSKAGEFEANAFHMAEGKRLFLLVQLLRMPCQWRRRNGPCSDGRKMDLRQLDREASTPRFVDGRPNGMPTFRNKIPDDQIWEISAYVRSLEPASPFGFAFPR